MTTTVNNATPTPVSVPTLTAPGADLVAPTLPGTTPAVGTGVPVPIGPIPGSEQANLASLLPAMQMLGMGSMMYGGNAAPMGAYGVSPYGPSPYGPMPVGGDPYGAQQPGLLSSLSGSPQMNINTQKGLSPSPNGLTQRVGNTNTFRSSTPINSGWGSPYSGLGSSLYGWNSLYSNPYTANPASNYQSPWLNSYTAPLQGPEQRTGIKAFFHKLFLGF